MRTGLRAGVVAALAGGVLLAPAAADAKRFSIKAPKPGQVVIAQIRGTSTGNKPPRLTLTNPRALRGTAIASSTWKAKGGGGAYDGIVVLLRKAAPGGSARTPAGAPAPATFNGTLLQKVILTVSVYTMLTTLRPTALKVREAAAKTKCANNLRTLGLMAHQYHGSTHPTIPPRIFIRQVCGAVLDQTVPGAPRFWHWANQPFCAMKVEPFGSSIDEIKIFGSCNHAVSVFGVIPPPPFTGTACLPFAGSSCEVAPEGVFFDFSVPWERYGERSANVRVNGVVGVPNGWEGAAAGPGIAPFFFPFDPAPDRPRFP